MKFRFVTSVAGALYSFSEGTVIEPTEIDDQVKAWLESRVIVPVRDDGLEYAVVTPPETAVSLQRESDDAVRPTAVAWEQHRLHRKRAKSRRGRRGVVPGTSTNHLH